jgi:hypothetical protein
MTAQEDNDQVINAVVPLRCSSSADRALAQIRSGFGWIVFHHFRKAAGSSVTSFLLRVITEISGIIPHKKGFSSQPAQTDNRIENFIEAGSINLYHQEWGAFPAGCLSDPYEPPAVLVTAIREPLSRLLSEFNYAGPGSKMKTYTHDKIVTAWHNWMLHQSSNYNYGILRGCYLNNFYTRSLLGTCHIRHSEIPSVDYSPFYGNCPENIQIFGGGCPIEYRELTTADLELAKQVLQSFDLVFITERLSDAEVTDWACSVFGVQRAKIGNFEMRNQTKSVSSDNNPKLCIPHEIKQLLKKDNSLDLELYQFGRKLLKQRLLRWKKSVVR